MIARSRLELSVGIFIVIGLIILFFFVFLIRDFQIVKPGYRFDIVFGFANGVKMNAPVRLAGVDVGEVKGLSIYRDKDSNKTMVDILVWVNNSAKIPVNSEVWINTLGLLGEKYIEIIPGDNYGKVLRDKDVIRGKDPISMEEITEHTKELVLKIDDAISGLNGLLGKINKGEGTIGRLVFDETIYKNMEEMSEDLKQNPWKLLYRPKEKASFNK